MGMFLSFWINSMVFAANERILPLGDSITQADLDFNSYRRPLWHLLDDAGYVVDFIGGRNYNGFNPYGPPPNPDFDLDHEGHPGWKADGLLSKLPGWLTGYTPDIVLLHAGTNDLLKHQSIESTILELKGIIDVLRNDNPHVTVLLAQIIPTNHSQNHSFTDLNAQMQGIIDEKSTAQSPIILVDQNSGFDPVTDTYDDVHPNLIGEEKMAQKWFDALTPFLSLPPPDNTAPTVANVNARQNDTHVLIVFSEKVEQSSAEDIFNYQIDQGIEITDAHLETDLKSVTLTVSTLTPDITYQLNINGVLDRAENPNEANETTTFVFAESNRVTDGLLVLYDFQNGSGNIVYDISGVGIPMDLTIDNPNNVNWIPGGGLSVNSSTIISAAIDTKLFAASTASNEVTIETWIKPANTSQSGPARMVTLSHSSSSRNFTLGQHQSSYHARLRTTTAGDNGTSPATTTNNNIADTNLSHIVYTRDSAGTAKIYKNGVEVASILVDGDFSTWDGTHQFALANEVDQGRPWLGSYYLVATYGRALTSIEIQSNFNSGLIGTSDNFSPVADAGLPQTITDLDGDGHELVALDGTGSTDDQSIATYQWRENGIEIATGATPQVDLTVGVHTLTLTVTDMDNASSTDTVAITVEPLNTVNEVPIAQAGIDQTVVDTDNDGFETVSLDGSGSVDDQGIVAYQWHENANPIATGASPQVNLAVGLHTLTLTVTDTDNESTTDTVEIVVEAAVIDDIAPTLGNISAHSETSVTVLFSEPVEEASAETIANYQIDQGIEVVDAQLGADFKSVTLTVSLLTPNVTYQINVNGVLDLATIPNSTNDIATFSFSETHRVTDGLLILYDFQNGSGDVVSDISGLGTPMDLIIDNPNNVSWIPGGGLSVNASTIISATVDTKLFAACTASNEITIETWIESANTSQSGPARMVTYSESSKRRNFTLGPHHSTFHARVRTTTAGSNGTHPTVKTNDGVVETTLAHIVYTRDATGVAKIYKDGVELTSQLVDGDFSNWDETYQFALANEIGEGRPWLGNYYLVATYGRALSSHEVQGNFEAGLTGAPSNLPPVANAGATQTVTDVDGNGSQIVTLDGTGSTDDQGIASYEWRNNGGPIATTLSPQVSLSVGVHTLTLIVTDTDGASDTDTVVITIEAPNEAPISLAGDDQTIVDTGDDGHELVTLDGSGSTDDRGIVSYQWLVNGSLVATGSTPQLDLTLGIHVVTLTVTDTDGVSASDTVTITIEAAPAQSPVIDVASIILKGTVDGRGSPIQSITVSINGGLPENVDTLIPSGNTATWEKEINLPQDNANITVTSENEAAISTSTVMDLTY